MTDILADAISAPAHPIIKDKRAEHILMDVMRGLMAILVFSTHTVEIEIFRLFGGQSPLAIACNLAGRHAVLVFFLLSGHLITRSVLNNIRKNGQFQAQDYVASRVARIYPPLLGAILICAIVWGVITVYHLPGATVPYGLPGDLFQVRQHYDFQLYDIPRVLMMRGGLHNPDAPLWTLFIEVQIYALVLGIASFWQRNLWVKFASLALAFAAAILLRQNIEMVLVWMLGAATCFLTISRGRAQAIAGISFVIAVAMWLRGHEGSSQVMAACAYAMCLFYCFPRLVWPKGVVSTASFSYSLYVMHWPMLMLVLSLSQNWVGHSLARASMVAIIAYVSIPPIIIPLARFLERPHEFRNWLLEYMPKTKKAPELSRPSLQISK